VLWASSSWWSLWAICLIYEQHNKRRRRKPRSIELANEEPQNKNEDHFLFFKASDDWTFCAISSSSHSFKTGNIRFNHCLAGVLLLWPTDTTAVGTYYFIREHLYIWLIWLIMKGPGVTGLGPTTYWPCAYLFVLNNHRLWMMPMSNVQSSTTVAYLVVS
jgi:hypothetical protein